MAYLHDLFDSYWLEYASYYIKERAIPHIDDGLKPVQRRILHALQRIDDGRFHKVANVVGQTMQFHPTVTNRFTVHLSISRTRICLSSAKATSAISTPVTWRLQLAILNVA